MMPPKPTHIATYKHSPYLHEVVRWGPKIVVVFHGPDPWGQPSMSISPREHWTFLDRIEVPSSHSSFPVSG